MKWKQIQLLLILIGLAVAIDRVAAHDTQANSPLRASPALHAMKQSLLSNHKQHKSVVAAPSVVAAKQEISHTAALETNSVSHGSDCQVDSIRIKPGTTNVVEQCCGVRCRAVGGSDPSFAAVSALFDSLNSHHTTRPVMIEKNSRRGHSKNVGQSDTQTDTDFDTDNDNDNDNKEDRDDVADDMADTPDSTDTNAFKQEQQVDTDVDGHGDGNDPPVTKSNANPTQNAPPANVGGGGPAPPSVPTPTKPQANPYKAVYSTEQSTSVKQALQCLQVNSLYASCQHPDNEKNFRHLPAQKIAIGLHGKHFSPNDTHWHGFKNPVDYEKHICNFRSHVLEPLLNYGHTVHVFAATYHSEKEQQMLKDFPMTGSRIVDEKNGFGDNRVYGQHQAVIELLAEAVDKSPDKKPYDILFNTRFDMHWMRDFSCMALERDKINIAFMTEKEGPQDGVDDNLIIFPGNWIAWAQRFFKHQIEVKAHLPGSNNNGYPSMEMHYFMTDMRSFVDPLAPSQQYSIANVHFLYPQYIKLFCGVTPLYLFPHYVLSFQDPPFVSPDYDKCKEKWE